MSKFLKFYTPNCSTCKALDRFIEENFPELEIQHIDATRLESQPYVELYSIHAVPTMLRLDDSEILIGFQVDKAREFLKGN